MSRWFNVWYLNLFPDRRVILSSYEATFAATWGRKVRNTINSHYRELAVRVAEDSSAANQWDTTEGGGMYTAGVGGAITGRGCNLLIVDDPLKNMQDANSQVMRDRLWDWWESTAYTRLEPDGAAIVVQTRWHTDDLAGRLIAAMQDGTGEHWDVLDLPAIADDAEHDQMGRLPGEPLWPARFSADDLARIRTAVGPYVWEALYQQRPTAAGGTIFQRGWWEGRRYAVEDEELARGVIARFISWDTALKDNEGAAYTAATVGELWADYRLGVREVYRERLDFPGLEAAIESYAELYNRDGKLQHVVIEDKASGTSAIQTLKANAPGWLSSLIRPYTPHGDKEYRAKIASSWCANGMVWLPGPSPHAPWLFEFEKELFTFPRSAYADQVDSFVQLVLWAEHYLEEGLRARQAMTGEIQ